jgi:hypothetical protein
MADAATRLPFGKQFSPTQTPLNALVGLIVEHAGDRGALEAAIGESFFAERGLVKTLAMNTFLAVRAYGLVAGDADYKPTPLAHELSRLRERDAQKRFAFHILTDTAIGGFAVVSAVQRLRAQGGTINNRTVARALRESGIDPGGGRGENVGTLRLWLEQGGAFESGWTLNDEALHELLGPSVDEIATLQDLPLDRRAFLRALASTQGDAPFSSQDVAATADLQSHTNLRALRDLPARVLTPLHDAGWLVAEKTTGGRGAKAYLVTPTEKFLDEISRPLMDALIEQVGVADPAMLRKPLAELLEIVRTEAATNERGLALEGVAIHIIRMMGAHFRDWRSKAREKGQAEVDLIAELVNGRYSIVQVQSKVSAITGRETVDREAGVSLTVLADIILFVSAKKIGRAARRAADEYMRITGLSIIFLDGDDLDALARGGSIERPLAREFRRVAITKRHAVEGGGTE